MTMAQPVAGLNPALLVWARERAGLTVAQVADAVGKGSEVVASWEAGTSAPTYIQLEKLAYTVYRRPIALLFFPEPPSEPDPHQSFRTLPDFEIDELSAETRFRIRQARAVQLSFIELSDGANPSPRFVLRDLPSVASSPGKAAEQIRQFLGVDLATQRGWRSNREALAAWRASVESAGVFVFKDTFKQRDVSGFSLYDTEFPIIYINNSTAKTRQMFTLFHELGHLLFHTNGVTKRDDSYIGVLRGEAREIEVFCNRFAADVLVPENALAAEDLSPTDRNILRLSRLFNVSREVILRRLLDRGAVSRAVYEARAREWAADYFEAKASEEGGGDYYATQASYLSDTYTRLAFRRYYQGSISIEDLARHLNMKIGNVSNFEQAVLQKAG
jgi:Zn-dependent peptidase ImmA (M78 family)